MKTLIILSTPILLILVLLFPGCSKEGCKPPSPETVSVIVDVSVEACELVGGFVPPPGQEIVELVCTVAGGASKAIKVFIAAHLWERMQADYIVDHGALPQGMALYRAPGRGSLEPATTVAITVTSSVPSAVALSAEYARTLVASASAAPAAALAPAASRAIAVNPRGSGASSPATATVTGMAYVPAPPGSHVVQ